MKKRTQLAWLLVLGGGAVGSMSACAPSTEAPDQSVAKPDDDSLGPAAEAPAGSAPVGVARAEPHREQPSDLLEAIPELPASERPQTDFDSSHLAVPEGLTRKALEQKVDELLEDDTRALERRARLERMRAQVPVADWNERSAEALRSRETHLAEAPNR